MTDTAGRPELAYLAAPTEEDIFPKLEVSPVGSTGLRDPLKEERGPASALDIETKEEERELSGDSDSELEVSDGGDTEEEVDCEDGHVWLSLGSPGHPD